jgi:predicted dehydrogenase
MCDLNEDLMRARAEEFGYSGPTTTSYQEMLDAPHIDVIAIYTPDQLHGEHIRRALEHGKHVICTKPLLPNLSEAESLVRAQRKAGRTVFVGQSTRFFESFIHQREDFENGRMGELETVEAYYHADHRWFSKKAWAKTEGFNWLYGGMSHPVDLLRWYLPDIEEVSGYGRLSKNGAEAGLKNADTYHFSFRTKAGLIARASGVYSCKTVPEERDSHMSCILRGTKGASQADYNELRYSYQTDEDGPVIEPYDDLYDYYFRFQGRSHHAGEYQNYIEYFAGCLDEGSQPQPGLEEGIGTVALMQAMEQAAASGSPVRVSSVLNGPLK